MNKLNKILKCPELLKSDKTYSEIWYKPKTNAELTCFLNGIIYAQNKFKKEV